MRAKKNDFRRASPIAQYSLRVALNGADGRKTGQARAGRELQPDCGRNGNARPRVRTGAKPDDNRVGPTKFLRYCIEILEKG